MQLKRKAAITLSRRTSLYTRKGQAGKAYSVLLRAPGPQEEGDRTDKRTQEYSDMRFHGHGI